MLHVGQAGGPAAAAAGRSQQRPSVRGVFGGVWDGHGRVIYLDIRPAGSLCRLRPCRSPSPGRRPSPTPPGLAPRPNAPDAAASWLGA